MKSREVQTDNNREKYLDILLDVLEQNNVEFVQNERLELKISHKKDEEVAQAGRT